MTTSWSLTMDPDACVTRTADALRSGDIEEARHGIEDLRDWLARGGFSPDWSTPDATYFISHVWKTT